MCERGCCPFPPAMLTVRTHQSLLRVLGGCPTVGRLQAPPQQDCYCAEDSFRPIAQNRDWENGGAGGRGGRWLMEELDMYCPGVWGIRNQDLPLLWRALKQLLVAEQRSTRAHRRTTGSQPQVLSSSRAHQAVLMPKMASSRRSVPSSQEALSRSHFLQNFSNLCFITFPRTQITFTLSRTCVYLSYTSH